MSAVTPLSRTLSLPSGGGPVRGLDPQLAVDANSGRAALEVPIATTPARGRELSLVLRYHSGGGPGPYGLGWDLDLPAITRVTTRGVPRYDDTDTFAVTGAGPVVPALDADGAPAVRAEADAGGSAWRVTTYLPVVNEGWLLIERWQGPAGEHWTVVDGNNVTSVFGRDEHARVADPRDPGRVFQWLVEQIVDADGNVTRFEYLREDGTDVREEIFEHGRERTARRYPHRIRYGNHGTDRFAYELLFDYGQYDVDGPDPYTPVRPRAERADPFSSYAAGFEVRTYRLCRGLLMFHDLPELGPRPVLVGATLLGYDDDPHGTLLTSVIRAGYRPDDRAALPPLRLSYTPFDPPPVAGFTPLRVEGGATLPGYLSPDGFAPVDLDGQGLPGFLYSGTGPATYYRPRGDGRYATAAVLPSAPDTGALSTRDISVADLDGDGGLQLVVLTRETVGCFTRTGDGWSPFRPMRSVPTGLGAPRGEFADLDGNGRADLVFVGRDAITFYPSLGTAGYGPARSRPRPADFPSAAAGSAVEAVAFADMFSDGLSHRLQVRDGEVTVWPSLGHGRFGPAVRLAGAPRLPAGVTSTAVHLADLDGSGSADLVVATPTALLVYRSRSGNGFDPAYAVPLPAGLDRLDQVSFADVLGTGTTAVVVSRMAPDVRHWYTDLCGGTRPYLLRATGNGLGGSCAVEYASSTRFLLADQRAGKPWLSRMPAPQQVVTAITARDDVSGTDSRTAYDYHDGYFDPVDRQFRGFAAVETVTTQAHVAPVRIRTWYHVGAYVHAAAVLARARSRYWAGDPGAYPMPDCVFEGDPGRAAYRAPAGQVLRVEVYGDGPVPLSVSAHNYTVRPAPDGAGSFLVDARESVEATYEGDATDPRTRHTVVLARTLAAPGPAESFLELTATVDYPRRGTPPGLLPEQRETRAEVEAATFSRVTSGFRRVGQPLERELLQLGGLAVPPGGYFTFAALAAQVREALADRVPYGAPVDGDRPRSRPQEHDRVHYWNAAQDAALPVGQLAPAALVHHQNTAAFSDHWLAEVFGDRVEPALLARLGYEPDAAGYWWRPGPVTTYLDGDGFHLPVRVDGRSGGPFLRTTGGYDPYLLVRVTATAYADEDTALSQSGAVDHLAAALWQVTDANGVVRQVRYDPLGEVLAESVRKDGTGDGDLRQYQVRPHATVGAVLADKPRYLQDAGAYHCYDRTGVPGATVSLVRPDFASEPGPTPPTQTSIVYADGAGALAQRRDEAEPGTDGATRWIVSDTADRTVSGLPVREYLAFYAEDPGFGHAGAVAPRESWYDPAGRLVRTLTPKGFLTRSRYGAWHQEHADEDDTVLESPFYLRFTASYPPDPTPAERAERDALDKAARLAGTPTVSLLDVAGNPVRLVRDPADPATGLLSAVAGYDGQNRLVRAVDPRLHRHNVDTGSAWTSATYAYPMGSTGPALATSPDAGDRWVLPDALDRPAVEWDGRGIRTDHGYDGLDRAPSTTVDGRLVVAVTFGESVPDAAAANLNGQPYLVRDQTGTLRTPRYAITGDVLESVRHYTVEHTVVPDWSHDVPLEETPYRSTLRHDACGRLIEHGTPDGTALRLAYHVSGRLATVTGTDAAGVSVRYLASAHYTAAGARSRTRLGNGAVQTAEHEDTTERLLGLSTTRLDGTAVQRVSHAYDPVGNVTSVTDATPALAFHRGTQVAVGDYRYDAVYRLIEATGLQQPGIDADTHATGFKQTMFADLDTPSTLDGYVERYTYDDADNLVRLEHDAALPFVRATPVEPTSDRLAGTAYDGAGNPLSLAPDGAALTWDGQGRLAHTAPVARPDGTTERTWFCYDAQGDRTRIVVERTGPGGGPGTVEETRIVGGGWEQDRVDGAPVGSRLRLADGDTPYADVRSPGGTRYQIADRQVSVVLELDPADGSVETFEAFFPYGGSSVIAATTRREAEPKIVRWTGQPADDSTGLYRFPARYEAPWLGRWLEPDPSGPVDGLNLYGYTGGNPATFHDPTGRTKTDGSGARTPQPLDQLAPLVRPAIRGLVYGLRYSAQHAFVYAPLALYARFFGTPDEQRLARENRRARLDEFRRIYLYGMLGAVGIDIERWVPPALLHLVQPRHYSAANLRLPGSRRRIIAVYAEDELRNPAMWAQTVGTGVGSLLTSGVALTLLRARLLRGRTSFWLSAITFPLPYLATFTLGAIGRGYENDQVWAAYRHQHWTSRPWWDVRAYLRRAADAGHGARRYQEYEAYRERLIAALPADPTLIIGGAVTLLAVRSVLVSRLRYNRTPQWWSRPMRTWQQSAARRAQVRRTVRQLWLGSPSGTLGVRLEQTQTIVRTLSRSSATTTVTSTSRAIVMWQPAPPPAVWQPAPPPAIRRPAPPPAIWRPAPPPALRPPPTDIATVFAGTGARMLAALLARYAKSAVSLSFQQPKK